MNTRALDCEPKEEAAALSSLSLLEVRLRPGYESSTLIHARSDGQPTR